MSQVVNVSVVFVNVGGEKVLWKMYKFKVVMVVMVMKEGGKCKKVF